MKLNATHLSHVYCGLMKVMMGDQPGVQQMLARADNPECHARPGPVPGLKDAINDLFAMHAPFLPFEREKIDAEFRRRGLPPLRVIEAARSRKFSGILKRGIIRNEEEFYLVKGLLDDEEPDVPEDELRTFGEIMAEYLRRSTRDL